MAVLPVHNQQAFTAFLSFQRKVYQDDPFFVPNLHRELKFLLGDSNPFWCHAKRKLFLLESNGQITARVAAITDSNQDSSFGFFGFFEALPDCGELAPLFDAAGSWLREQGKSLMRGPVNPSMNETCGLLIEGFETSPLFMMPYNPPFYLKLLELQGFRKAKDLYAFHGPIKNPAPEKLTRIASRVGKKYPDISFRPIQMKCMQEDLKIIRDIYNEAWSDNWGFSSMTDAEIVSMAKRLKPLVVPEFIQIAMDKDAPVGFIWAMPDYNPIFKKWNGRMWPWHLLSFPYDVKKIDRARVLALGVKGAHRKKGIDAGLIRAVYKAGFKRGYQWAEYSWILEDNVLTHRISSLMGGKLTKKYRILEKRL
jgi:hypothetical protein